MDYSLLFPNRFLKSAEFKGRDVTLKMTGIVIEELEGDKGKKAKGIVSFDGTKKQWVLNRTNAECLRAMFGRDTDQWIGKRVTLWPAPYTDSFTGEVGTAIRVRGSPDIKETMAIEVHLPRKKPVRMTMQKTGGGNGKAAVPPPPAAPPEPPPQDFAEEDPLHASEMPS